MLARRAINSIAVSITIVIVVSITIVIAVSITIVIAIAIGITIASGYLTLQLKIARVALDWGLEIRSVEVLEISPSPLVQEAMHQQLAAERVRRVSCSTSRRAAAVSRACFMCMPFSRSDLNKCMSLSLSFSVFYSRV